MQTKATFFRWWAIGLAGWLGSGAMMRADEPPATALAAMGEERPAGILRTVDGRLYLGIRDPKADETGLTFRHQSGAARISRERLSATDQKRYGLPPLDATAPNSPATGAGTVSPAHPATVPLPLVLTYRVRVNLPQTSPMAGDCALGCGATLASRAWPSHWPRPHYGLAYPLFPCRQAAERDFLLTTGLLPRPPWIVPWRLR